MVHSQKEHSSISSISIWVYNCITNAIFSTNIVPDFKGIKFDLM